MLLFFKLCLITTGHAQTFEEFARQREAKLAEFKQEREAFIKQMNQRFEEYVAQRDKEFTDYLKQRWEEYELFAGERLDDKPKPPVIPAHEPAEKPHDPRPLPVAPLPTPDVVSLVVEPQLPIIQKPEPERFPTRTIRFPYYGNNIALRYDPNLVHNLPANINNESISDFWTLVSKGNYNHLVNQLGEQSQRMNLNDWGYYLLVRNAARELYPRSESGANLMAWFLMNRSGYKARIGYQNNRAMIMLPAMQDIYGLSFLVFQGMKYYLVEGSASSLFTYDEDFPDAHRIMDMNIRSPLNLGNILSIRELTFQYDGTSYALEFEYCQNSIQFYADYPQTQISVYFDSAPSPVAKVSLSENLMALIQDKSESDAAGLLLHFTQTAFDYKTDDEQFGFEKFFFAEEVLHYPYSDCEDRSVLFAYLLRELLNLKVIGLEYPDHIATAVRFSEDPGGDYVMFNGEKYTVCDPTFINAPIGLTMPKYADVAAQVVEIDDVDYYYGLREKIWEHVLASGGFRGGNRNDLAFDKRGNGYVAGYFNGSANFGSTTLRSENNSRGAFLASYNNKGELLWVRQPTRQENTTAYHVAVDDDLNVYFAGTFNNNLVFENRQLEASLHPDVFIAKYSPAGRFLWAEKLGTDTLDPGLPYIFVATYSKTGRKIDKTLYNEHPDFANYGIHFDAKGHVLLTGASFVNPGMNIEEAAYATSVDFDPVRSLKEENDRLIREDYEPSIAGIFAAINLIKLNNVVIPGKAAQQALDRYNPDFKKTAPNVYAAIARISFLKNDQGVVLIATDNGRTVTIDYLRIRNNSLVKVTEFSNGNTQLDILSGMSVGKAIIWYDLNFVRLLKDSGDMLFDYARDNTQRVFNLRNDIFY